MLRDSSSNVSSSKSKRSEIKSEISEERKSSSNKKVEGPKFISVKAGRLKNKKKRKRYRYGPKKGEIITSSDESVTELNINTTDWSSSSLDECNLPKNEREVKPILARGPLPPPRGWTGKQNRASHSENPE